MVVFRVILSFLFLAALWSPAGKGLTFWLSYFRCFLCFCHFPIWCPGSGVVFDCHRFPFLCLDIVKMYLYAKFDYNIPCEL